MAGHGCVTETVRKEECRRQSREAVMFPAVSWKRPLRAIGEGRRLSYTEPTEPEEPELRKES